MAPKPRRKHFRTKKQRSAVPIEESEPVADSQMEVDLPPAGSLRHPQKSASVKLDSHLSPAVQRRQFYAMLAWQTDYSAIIRLEASTNSAAVNEVVSISQYARRILRQSGAAAEQMEERLHLRRNDIVGYIQRVGNVHAVPWPQAMRGISFLNDQICSATWDQERKGRRVVSRAYALWTLEEMAACRPPPPFDVHDGIASIGFDQTYVRGPGVHVELFWLCLTFVTPSLSARTLPHIGCAS